MTMKHVTCVDTLCQGVRHIPEYAPVHKNLPFFCLVDDVTYLHVERPILWLQRAAGGSLCQQTPQYGHADTGTDKCWKGGWKG